MDQYVEAASRKLGISDKDLHVVKILNILMNIEALKRI